MRKQLKRICSIVTTLALLLSMTVLAAHAEEPLTIKSVEYGANYTATHATENDWINSPSASSNVVKVTLSDGTTRSASEGNVLTLVIDGVQVDILDWLEFNSGEDALTLEGEEGVDWCFYETSGSYSYKEFAKFMNMGGNDAQYTYRAALTIKDNAVVDTDSIRALFSSAKVDGSSVTGGHIWSLGAFFNGVIVKGSSDVTISGTDFLAVGDGANDFQGEAAAVLAQDSSTVTLDGVTIETAGVIRTAAAVKDSGKLVIKNSVIFTQESLDTQEEYDALVVPMMKRTPFALGIEGVVRATNVLGAGQGIYSDSLIVSTGWGVLSTDSGRAGTEALNVKNVLAGIGEVEVYDEEYAASYTATREVNGVKYGYTMTGSGYVAYADAGVIDKFDNVEFYSPDYIQIMASSTSSAYYTNSVLTSGRIAVMTQQNKGGTISIQDSTVNVADTVAQIKSGAANEGYTNVVLDHAAINFTADNPWGGILVELVESDDAGNPGNTTFTVNDEGDVKGMTDAKGIQGDSYATLKNGDYAGDIFNNIYNYYAALNVTLEKANLTGTVSSSYGYHVGDDGQRLANGTVLTAATSGDYREDPKSGDYIKIGAQVNVVSPTDVNPVNLTVDADSTWTVGEVNYLNELTLASGDVLKGAGTIYASKLTVGGEAMPDGEYTYGSVKVIVKYNQELADWLVVAGDSGILGSGQDYSGDANKFEIKVVDEEGNGATRFLNTDNAVKANADGTISFNVVAAEGYTVEVVEIKHDDNVEMHDSTEPGYAYGFTVTKAEPTEGGDPGPGPMGPSASNVTVVVKVTENGGPTPPPEGGDGTGTDMIASTEVVDNGDGTYTIKVTMNGMELDDFDVSLVSGDEVVKTVAAKGGQTIEFDVTEAGKYVIRAAFTGGGGPYMGLDPQETEVNVGNTAPEGPGEGDKPAPGEGDKPDTGTGTEEKPGSVQTGDSSIPVVMACIALLAAAGFVTMTARKRKEN